MHTIRRQQGFTLIEIAIVLVIIGLLLGGILKGQELITSARVRNLISQQDGIKAGFYGFQDRYRALPGDYQQASQNLGGNSAATNGNGDGRITDATTAAGGGTAPDEQNLVWDHLTRAGFLNGNFVYAAGTPTDTTTPKNPYGRYLDLRYDNVYFSTAAATPTARHNLKTGSSIPVEIMAEIDRKVDDGNAGAGAFVYSPFGSADARATCSSDTGVWAVQGSTSVNCGGASLL